MSTGSFSTIIQSTMKSSTLILAALGLLCGEAAAIDVLTRGFSLGPRSDLSVSCDGIYGFLCENCTHIKLCANTNAVVRSCSDISPEAQYCNKGACSADPVIDGTPCTPHFDCMGAGNYPDLTDCTRYFLCPQAGGDPEMFQCPPGRVYSSKLEGCKLKRVPADCETLNCAKTPGIFQILKSDPSVLAVCPADGGNPFVMRCRDSVSSQYNPKTLTCEYKCPAEGRYPDRLDCHKFYECYKSGTAIQYMHQDCGLKFKYDPVAKKCVPGEQCDPEVPKEPEPAPAPTPEPPKEPEGSEQPPPEG